MNEETKLPEGLALAVEMLAEFVGIAVRDGRNAAATQRDGAAAVGAIRAEHAQRLTMQHHVADMAQRVADLEKERDTYKAAWSGYHPLANYMQQLSDADKLPVGVLGRHYGDAAVKHMRSQEARITYMGAQRDKLQHEHHAVRADAQARVDAAVIRALAAEKERDELRSRTELAESRLAVMVERDGARDEQLRLACRERDGLRARLAELAGKASEILDDVRGLVDESEGVAGLHQNGDIANWDSLLPGGRFERLSALDDLESIVSAIAATPEYKA